jgi:hypothetical protein
MSPWVHQLQLLRRSNMGRLNISHLPMSPWVHQLQLFSQKQYGTAKHLIFIDVALGTPFATKLPDAIRDG